MSGETELFETVHLNEAYWKDAMEFKPSRWENVGEDESKAFFPFSAGPRVCIGKNFALLEIKTLISLFILLLSL